REPAHRARRRARGAPARVGRDDARRGRPDPSSRGPRRSAFAVRRWTPARLRSRRGRDRRPALDQHASARRPRRGRRRRRGDRGPRRGLGSRLIAPACAMVLLAAAAACAVPRISRASRAVSVLAALMVMALALAVLGGIRGGPLRFGWAGALGAGSAVDLDELGALFVALTGIIFAAGALASERVGHRRAYFALWDLLLASLV